MSVDTRFCVARAGAAELGSREGIDRAVYPDGNPNYNLVAHAIDDDPHPDHDYNCLPDCDANTRRDKRFGDFASSYLELSIGDPDAFPVGREISGLTPTRNRGATDELRAAVLRGSAAWR